ncbi:MAG: class 1 fructose-bisphosphatase [Gemmatimonadota bacterium]|nr:MAG: class 1 fructose-bisphosphatase [Gemmatimonadota bacterium]
MSAKATSLSRHLVEEGKWVDAQLSELPVLLRDMGYTAKILAREIRRAALVGKLGLVGEKNPSGDAQKKLDVYSNEVVVDAFTDSGLVAAIVSEEMEELRTISCNDAAEYLLCVDPLDGSSNTDVNGAVGTIFSFYRRGVAGACTDCEAELREGARLVAAGYVLYGPSTVLVCSMGRGVNGYTLDHDVGEFMLSQENIRCPVSGAYYSANLGRYHDWDPNVRAYADYVIERDAASGRPYSLRYSGALVADVHRSLLEGGIYLYPADEGRTGGKLRLLYECLPLAFVVEAAAGRASSGRERILDLRPASLHQTSPLAIGGVDDVQLFERFVATGSP